MPTIDVSYKDLCRLVGKNIPLKELKEKAILFAKSEIADSEGDLLKVEVADTNRPDLWSAEGIAREIQGRYTLKSGLPKYTVKSSGLKVIVDKSVASIRPLTVCAVVSGLRINAQVLGQLIQLQEKLCENYGKKRKEVAIGVYDYQKIHRPIFYKAFAPHALKFVPLDFDTPLDLLQILQQHPKGREYAHLLDGCNAYPVFIDSAGQVLSMPPIINSDHTGKVTEKTKTVFIECSGFDLAYLVPALQVVVAALVERGGKAESVEICYEKKKMITPDFTPGKMQIGKKQVIQLFGTSVSDKKIIELLSMARYDATVKGENIEVLYPAYRHDIMHPVDIIEDILISEGFNEIAPVMPMIGTIGCIARKERLARKVREIMISLQCQEIMSYVLTNLESLYDNMNLPRTLAKDALKYIEIDNPVSNNWSVFRNWLLPSIMEFLSRNTKRQYPQRIFEIGEVVLFKKDAETRSENPLRIAYASASAETNYTEAKQALDFLLDSLKLQYEVIPAEHLSFIPGRVGRIIVKGKKVGFLGEIHPQVLKSWNLEMPVAGFELNLTELLDDVELG
ncbi:MAG: phenylalanine--tRNA ligase subunit beta [Nanoarchaeota archaeon]